MPAPPDDKTIGSILGSSLRSARHQAGLTMQQLAELSGVSQPHLSQMENGKTAPSINTLYRLSNALGVSPQRLLPQLPDAATAQVVRAGSVVGTPIIDSPTAAVAQLLIGSPERMLQVQQLDVGPGEDLGSWFRHDGEEYLFVVAGQLLLELEGQAPVELGQGDSAWYPSTRDHRWSVLGTQHATLLVVSAVADRQFRHEPPPTRGGVG